MNILNLFKKRKATGLIKQNIDKRDYIYLLSGTTTSDETDLRLKFPNTSNQYNYNSCTAHAVCALLDYELKYNRKFEGWDFNSSEAFLWYFSRYKEGNQDKNVGCVLRNTFKVIQDYGFVRQESWQYANGIYIKPYAKVVIEGQLFALQLKTLPKYYSLPKDIIFIKDALDNNHPIVFGFPLSSDFMYLKEFKFNGSIQATYGNHAMLIVGYNNDGVIVRNSWGSDFGENGYCLIPWNLFIENSFDLWCLQ